MMYEIYDAIVALGGKATWKQLVEWLTKTRPGPLWRTIIHEGLKRLLKWQVIGREKLKRGYLYFIQGAMPERNIWVIKNGKARRVSA